MSLNSNILSIICEYCDFFTLFCMRKYSKEANDVFEKIEKTNQEKHAIIEKMIPFHDLNLFEKCFYEWYGNEKFPSLQEHNLLCRFIYYNGKRDLKVLEKIINLKNIDLNHRYINGDTSLHRICGKSCKNNIEKYEIIKMLIQYGSNVNLQNDKGETALQYCFLEYNNEKIIQLLIDNGANPNILNNNGMNALHHICMHSNNVNYVEILLKANVNIDSQTKNRYTALHIAVIFGLEKIVEMLLQAGAIINIKNNKNETPIDCAYSNKFNDMKNIIHLLESH